MHIDDGRAVPNFITQALKGETLTIYGDGAQTRSFCYVDDLIEGIISLLYSEEHDPINIGNPQEISIKEFAETINALIDNGSTLEYLPDSRSPGDPQQRQPDISRAEKLLGWSPKVPIKQGLEHTIRYFKKQLGLK
jgi:dTDP-glucose 4,6-dehydratase